MITVHNCPIKNCPKTNLPREILMCRKHWFQLSSKTQSRVYRVWHQLEAGKISIKDYMLVREEAIKEVEAFITKQPSLF